MQKHQKLCYIIFSLFLIIGCSTPEGFEGDADRDETNPIYLASNGLTVKAKDWASVGDSGIINGIEYTIVSGSILRDMVSSGDDITRVCVSRITDMEGLFWRKTYFNQDISNWDVSNVTNMSGMFGECPSFNQNISDWDTRNVLSMFIMFIGANSFNQDLGSWNVSKVGDCLDFDRNTPNWTLPRPNFEYCRITAN